jgi:hypothetical protein
MLKVDSSMGALRGGAEALEFAVGAVEGAFEAHFVIGEVAEGVKGGGIADEGAGDELVGGQFGFAGLGNGFALVGKPGFAGLGEEAVAGGLLLIDVGLDAGEAGEFPVGDGHLLDEDFLEATEGTELVAEGFVEAEERVFVLAGEESGACAETVGEGVLGGDGFADGGFGAGGAAGVATVGVDLLLGGHGSF